MALPRPAAGAGCARFYGNVYSALRGSYSTLITWGPTGNSGVESVMGVEVSSPSPVWEWTAAYTAQACQGFWAEAPARPLQTLELTGIFPALKQDRWTKAEANALAGVGVAVQMLGAEWLPGDHGRMHAISAQQLRPA